MKIVITILFFTNCLIAQNLDNILIVDNCKLLNNREANLLNILLKDTRNSYDFHGKKAAFVTGPSGNLIINKSIFFEKNISPWINKGDVPQLFMFELSEEEKMKSGGYEVILVAWVKIFRDKQKQKIINKLSLKKYSCCL